MLKVKVFTVGKNKEKWINDGIKEYEKRLSKTMHFEWIFFKNISQLETCMLKENFFICLDVLGHEIISQNFSEKIFNSFEENNSKLNFVIGDANGLPLILKERSNYNLSLSKLTFTHQMSRLILIEQLYRADQIMKNTKYQR
jgi:23S rRNA (pseudouridine1915-N3)-methyltransferase